MGSSMSLRSGAIFSQLQKRHHWRQAVVSFLKTVAEKPLLIACCVAWQLAAAFTRMAGGADAKAYYVVSVCGSEK